LPLSVGSATLEFISGKHYNIANASEWATLVPPHHGRVKLGSPQQEFDIAIYSDIECLDTIRNAFITMRDGSGAPSKAAEECLGQIRQAILCTADLTLEPAVVVCEDASQMTECDNISSGEHVRHLCRDWVQVRKFVETNQGNWGFPTLI
ncbi:hypothetical protein FB451DRAFT_1047399, partial [Mycena latifolia]